MTRVTCAVGFIVSLCLLASDALSLRAAAVGSHAYFDALVARPEHWKSYSLRSQAQLLQYKNSNSGAPWVNYVWPNDPDPRRQDAAKVVVPAFAGAVRSTLATAINATETVLLLNTWSSEFYTGRALKMDSESAYITAIDKAALTLTVTRGLTGTSAASHSAGTNIYLNTNSLLNQVRLPVGTENGHKYLFTWDVYYTDSYLDTGLTNHKAYQFSNQSDGLMLELQTRFSGSAYAPGFNAATDAAATTFRSYNSLGGNADYSLNTGNKLGPGVTKTDPILPMSSSFIIQPNKWTRFWVLLEMNANDYDVFNFWAADEDTAPVQVYTDVEFTVDTVSRFWIEFNTSTDRFVRGNTRDLVAYVRNVAILRDVNVPSLLQGPAGGVPLPGPPTNLRVLH